MSASGAGRFTASPLDAAKETDEDDKGGGAPQIDDEDRARYANYIRLGFSPKDAQYPMGLTDEELAVLTGTAPAKPTAAQKSITEQLAEIAALRKNDPDKYWRSEAILKKELALLEARAKGQQQVEVEAPKPSSKSEQAPDAEPASEGDSVFAKLDAELLQIEQARKATTSNEKLDELDQRARGADGNREPRGRHLFGRGHRA